MQDIQNIQDAWLAIEDDLIVDYGKMDDWPGISDWSGLEVVDAANKIVLPAFCDSHTHLVFAAPRETEFVDRIKGLTYEEIAKRGGGILNSAKRLQNTSEDELFDSALVRLDEIKGMGTGAVEIKSGYGLSLKDEIKMLRVVKRLKQNHDLTIKASFLGAHAMPTEFKENREKYISILIDEMLPQVAQEQLADYCDVFCDKGFYTVDETDRILNAAAKYNLTPKIHANELDFSGGIQVGVKHKALSVDHLEFTGDEEIEALLKSDTMPTLLPSTAFFLGLHYPPARKMIDAGLPLALASDYNPGSSPSGKMTFILSLACVKLKMTPEEAVAAATINGAYAMGLNKTHGSITIGKKANLIITKEVSSLAYIPYAFGANVIDSMIINGKIENINS
jgi:imidazolonepropionase